MGLCNTKDEIEQKYEVVLKDRFDLYFKSNKHNRTGSSFRN